MKKLQEGNSAMDIGMTVAAEKPGVEILRLSGRLDGETYEAAQPILLEALGRAATGIVINLESLSFISSAGLRVMIVVGKQALSEGKRVALVSVPPAIYKIFKIACLDRVFHFYEDEGAALLQL
jgi:anti-anti-sigma factor